MAAEERARKLGLTDEELDNFLEDAETAAENVVWKMRLARTEGRAPLPDAQIETLIDEALEMRYPSTDPGPTPRRSGSAEASRAVPTSGPTP